MAGTVFARMCPYSPFYRKGLISQMPLPEVYTYCDALDALEQFARGYGASARPEVFRRCVRAARDEIMTVRDWSFLYDNDAILLRAAQTDGTVEYDHAGHATCERALVLADETWPDWAVDAAVRVDGLVCDIQEVKSDTVLQLDSVMNPGQDVAEGTSYTLYPRWYPLPADFGAMHTLAAKSAWLLGQYISMDEMFAEDKYRESTGDVRYYSIGRAQDQYGRMAIYVHPASDTTERIDFIYKKRPRDLRYSGHNAAEFAGTIEVTAGSPTVTGTETSFESGMAGSILRISANTDKPTGLEGTNAWAEQRVIKSVTDPDTLVLDANVGTSRDAVKYVISDPIDIDVVAWQAFLACAEKHFAMRQKYITNRAEIFAAYNDALFQAKQGDCRSTEPRVSGAPRVRATRLVEATSRPEVP